VLRIPVAFFYGFYYFNNRFDGVPNFQVLETPAVLTNWLYIYLYQSTGAGTPAVFNTIFCAEIPSRIFYGFYYINDRFDGVINVDVLETPAAIVLIGSFLFLTNSQQIIRPSSRMQELQSQIDKLQREKMALEDKVMELSTYQKEVVALRNEITKMQVSMKCETR
jgi:hypothetical protein